MTKTLSFPITILALSLFVSACTSIEVAQVDGSHKLVHVCIKENEKVIVNGFLNTIEDGFKRHLITTEIYTRSKPKHCEYHLTYTALRSWDFAPYLSHAELRLYKRNSRIAYAEYHSNGKGGFSLMKWASVKSKMTPVMDEFLAEYK
ncbi:MAG: hypothetical protein KUG71_11070 [Porticoccaceae bacterium]|nr:hypothetical protein [Porticoccaceae bacterium]